MSRPPPHFAPVAALFEGGLVAVALGLGWLLGVKPLASLHWTPAGWYWGAAAVLPLLAMLWLVLRWSWPPVVRLLRLIDCQILPLMRDLSLAEMAAISILAGLGEEMLFRGIVQAGMMKWIGGVWGIAVGLAVASLLFGLAHSLTIAYFVLASVIGLYLGAVWLWLGDLLAPIVAHAAYDFLAMFYLARWRRPPAEFESIEDALRADADEPEDSVAPQRSMIASLMGDGEL